MKIIDSHVHLVQYIAGTGSGGELRSCGNGDAIYASGEIVPQMIPAQFPYENARSYLKLGKEILGADRMMFGTDLPSALKKGSYKNYVNYIAESDVFTEKEKQLVFYDTADKLFF